MSAIPKSEKRMFVVEVFSVGVELL
jgi:hypothetical protein